jgi:D-sedoheptulose 7-phosphate isomerase
MENIIKESFSGHKKALELLEKNQDKIKEIAGACIAALKNNGKIIFMGNGGSAADSQHLAAELVGRFKKNRRALAAIAITCDTSILTAIGNDFGFDEVFSRQIEALAKPNDVVIGISTSGMSPDILSAFKKARELKVKTIGLLGKDGGTIKGLSDISLIIALNDTPRIQEMHILAGHIICELVEEEYAK